MVLKPRFDPWRPWPVTSRTLATFSSCSAVALQARLLIRKTQDHFAIELLVGQGTHSHLQSALASHISCASNMNYWFRAQELARDFIRLQFFPLVSVVDGGGDN